MVKKSNRRAKKRRLMSDPFNDLNEEDMVSDEGSDKGIKEEGDEEKPYLTLNGMHSDSEESDAAQDSDRELQVALKEGLLKTDRLNYVVRKKRPIINKVAELRAKLAKFEKKLPWLETLDVTVANDSMTSEAVDDDFEREIIFYKQAQEAVQTAVPRLLKMGVKVFRPADYYAEMAKSDEHMQKIRKRMLDMQESKQRQDAIRRLREEKKFAAKVQKEVLENRQAEKKKLLEAVKKHRKGMKSQLEDMLNNAKRLQRDELQRVSISWCDATEARWLQGAIRSYTLQRRQTSMRYFCKLDLYSYFSVSFPVFYVPNEREKLNLISDAK
ncbi:putative rRNA-processing protein EBP2 -like protein [Toxocara canis]|uniref:Putative rRNA-processing protein EBP2-like protein n=1 Tax=Toxocara canis TaxID=6265 RepID=A0A0B2VIV9_TOXCA|nr:putative rRNA-processing protein EBP2 -like protein [Toxocara canis]